MKLSCVFLLVCYAAHGNAAKLPSYATACPRNDKLNECALKSARVALEFFVEKGDRKYNIPVLDPLLITQMDINQSGLKIHYTNMKLGGMKDVNITDIRIDLERRHQEFDLFIPLLTIDADYEVGGRILVLPISGKGTARLTLANLKSTFSHNFDLVKKKSGKLHMQVRDTAFTSEPTLLTIKMENLFNGDKLLGDNMNLFMNENWRELLREIGPAFNAALGQVADQIYNGLTNLVPYDDMYLVS